MHGISAVALSKPTRAQGREVLCASLVLVLVLLIVRPSYGWQNGTIGAGGCSKCYGTHDFLAEHALDFLPYKPEYSWLMASGSRPHSVSASPEYLYGTEIPDLGAYGFTPDRTLHAVYYSSDGSLEDDYAAMRAQQYYQEAQNLLKDGNSDLAARYMGITSHYVTDVTSYWHVMGKGDEWIKAAKHGGLAYENLVESETERYNADFASCIVFDGKLEEVTPYDLTLKLAYDTTFDTSGAGRTAAWMDDHFESDWGTPYYHERVCQSLNLAVNALADLIYSIVQPAGTTATIISSVSSTSGPVASTVTVTTTSLRPSNVTVIVPTESVPGVGTMLPIAITAILVLVVLWALVRSRKKPTTQSSVVQDAGTSMWKGENR